MRQHDATEISRGDTERGDAIIYKALSVKQPWANLIASGKKTIETRTWRTNYRGLILICSSKNPPTPEPAGCVVAMAELYDCRILSNRDEKAACCDCSYGGYAWMLRNIQRVKPVPVKGELGIFTVDIEPPEIDQTGQVTQQGLGL